MLHRLEAEECHKGRLRCTDYSGLTHSSLVPRTTELTPLLSENHFGCGEVDGQ